MSDNVNDLISKLTEFLRNEAKTESVIGQPFQLGEYSCVPVIAIGLGLGATRGTKTKEDKESEIGGAAIGMGPIGFLVSKGDHIQFVSSRPPSGLNAVIERVPELIERYMTKKNAEDPAG